MEEKRKSERVDYEKPVEFGLVRFGPPPDPPKYKGHVVDLSEGGLFIKTDRVFKTGITLTLEIQDDGKCYEMEGTVTNAHKLPPALAYTAKSGMGIIIANPDPELLRIYKDKVGACSS